MRERVNTFCSPHGNDKMIRLHDDADNMIETHEHADEFKTRKD
jgi:hypothetical protein